MDFLVIKEILENKYIRLLCGFELHKYLDMFKAMAAITNCIHTEQINTVTN